MDDLYTCTVCKGVFEKAWGDEEAKEEAEEIFGKDVVENAEMVTVCDDCYQLMHPKDNPVLVDMARNITEEDWK